MLRNIFFKTRTRIALTGLSVAAGGGALYVARDDGLRRSVLFWTTALPIFVHYRITQVCVKR